MILGGGDISDFSFSKAWGVNPAAASGTVIIDTSGGGSTSFSLAVGDYVTYSFGSVASFTGVVSEVGTVTEWARGLVQSFQVVDNRVRLSWQAVFAAWNIEDDYYSKSMARPVSPSTGSDSSDSGDDSVDITGTDSETLPAVLAPPSLRLLPPSGLCVAGTSISFQSIGKAAPGRGRTLLSPSNKSSI